MEGRIQLTREAIYKISLIVDIVVKLCGRRAYHILEVGQDLELEIFVRISTDDETIRNFLDQIEGLGLNATDKGGMFHVEANGHKYSIVLGDKEARSKAESSNALETINRLMPELDTEAFSNLAYRMDETHTVIKLFKYCKVYDAGPGTFDRFIVFIEEQAFAMSFNPSSIQGFNQFVGDVSDFDETTLGKKITDPRELSSGLVSVIKQRIEEALYSRKFNSDFISVSKSPSDIMDQLFGNVEPDPTEKECIEIGKRLSSSEHFIHADDRLETTVNDLIAENADSILKQIRSEKEEKKEEEDAD